MQVSVKETKSSFLLSTKHLNSSILGESDIMLARTMAGLNSLFGCFAAGARQS